MWLYPARGKSALKYKKLGENLCQGPQALRQAGSRHVDSVARSLHVPCELTQGTRVECSMGGTAWDSYWSTEG